MKIENVNDAEAEVLGYHARYVASLSSDRKAKEDFDTGTHQRVYALMGDALRLSLALLAKPSILAELLTKRGVRVAGAGENEFGPVVRLLFRTQLKGGGTKFNKSAWKYGNVLRYCRDQGWSPDDVPKELEKLRVEIGGRTFTKLQAAELADRAKYKVDEDESQEEEFAFQHLLDGGGLGRVTDSLIDVEGRSNGQFISAALSWDEKSAQWVVRQVISTSSAGVRRAIRKQTVESFKSYTDELFRALALHNQSVRDHQGELPSAVTKFIDFHRKDEAEKLLVRPKKKSANQVAA